MVPAAAPTLKAAPPLTAMVAAAAHDGTRTYTGMKAAGAPPRKVLGVGAFEMAMVSTSSKG
jgi:hypothetical protein